jgi:hypothetical protein
MGTKKNIKYKWNMQDLWDTIKKNKSMNHGHRRRTGASKRHRKIYSTK